MHRNILTWALGTLLAGCTSMGPGAWDSNSDSRHESRNEPRYDSRSENKSAMPEAVRLAQAQVLAQQGQSVTGTVNFEQMPNSVIISYHLEGLNPKGEYQILVNDSQSCSSSDVRSMLSLKELRANKQGVSDNTFKTEDFSVSGNQALLGKTLAIVVGRSTSAERARGLLACGQVLPFNPPSQPAE